MRNAAKNNKLDFFERSNNKKNGYSSHSIALKWKSTVKRKYHLKKWMGFMLNKIFFLT